VEFAFLWQFSRRNRSLTVALLFLRYLDRIINARLLQQFSSEFTNFQQYDHFRMSSLRLALKQSLQDAGPLFKEKKKKKSGSRKNSAKASSERKGRRPRNPGDPPRKRGRPRKHPLPEEQQSLELQHSLSADSNAESRGDGDDGEHRSRDPNRGNHDSGSEDEEDSESENEFSYDSEEEEDDSEEEGEEQEDDVDGDNNESHGDEDESGHPEEEEDTPTTVNTGPASPRDFESSKKSRHEEEPDSDEERRRQKKLFKKHLQQAANKIQAQWKKKAGGSVSRGDGDESEGDEEGKAGDSDGEPSKPSASSPVRNRDTTTISNNSTPTGNGSEKKKKSSKSRTVPSPELDVLEWNRSLSEKKSRKHISSGMRVKVRFAAKVKREGKVVKKKIWYGGRVSAVSKEGSKIRIKYDDGTSEISKFPDKDVVVDDTLNGKHLVPADRFIPPERTDDISENQEEEEEEQELQMDVDDDSKKSTAAEVEVPKAAEKVSDSAVPASNPDNEQSMAVDEKPSEPASATETKEPTMDDKSFSENTQGVEQAKPATDPLPAANVPAEGTLDEGGSGEVNTPKSKSTGTIIASAIAAAEQGRLPRELGSPEERELSPGISLIERKKVESSTTQAPKPLDNGDGEGETPKPSEVSAEAETANFRDVDTQPEASNTAEKSSEPPSPLPEAKTQDALKPDEAGVNSIDNSVQPQSPTTPKRNLTIRISNTKMEQDGGAKTPKIFHSDSEEELFADTPITERKVKSIQLKGKKKRKRENVETTSSSEDQPSKKRIQLKQGTPEDDNSDLSMPQAEDGMGDKPVDVQGAVEPLGTLADPQHDGSEGKKSNTTISISLRKPETEEEDLLLPKLKKKKDRANSPVPKGRKSPVPGTQSPTPMVGYGGAEIANEPEPATGEDMGDDSVTRSPGRSKGILPQPEGGANDVDEYNLDPGTEENPTGAAENHSLPRSKGSVESLPGIRSGRRAAQQAKEKMNPKQEDKGPESLKKKKKRKRNPGDEEGEHSDGSVDDRQWVQCDSCGKWRILPSHIKISSLPKHWYCHLNTYDPKRNICSAPEQTAKQAAKDWRRARKRLKQQRLAELQIAEAGGVQEEPVAKIKKELPASSSPKPTKGLKKEKAENKLASPIGTEDLQATNPESISPKLEKKSKKVKPQQQQPPQEVVEPPPAAPVLETEAPKKPGRKRGRPARNQTPQKEKSGDDNVEWVQCEKCEKWRKLPPHLSADELPDTWYCTMNDWNLDAANCETPEDKADATHHEVGSYAGMFGTGAGKYSYRAMIFGTGKKHNRPMSERSRAAESLFMRPIDEIENPYPTVMYSKSSCFVPRTSNFTKASGIEEEKSPGIFDVLSNSELWAELNSVGHPVQVSSSNVGQNFPKFLSFENLPEDLKQAMRDIVLRSLGEGTLTAEEVMMEVHCHPWETYAPDLVSIRGCFNTDIIVNSLLALVRDGVVEMTSIRNFRVPMGEWVPKYRKVRSVRAMKIEEAIKASRCMKIAKPWKQREGMISDWVTGASAFS
jgi:hypothetical protein